MKAVYFITFITPFLFILILFPACNGQDQPNEKLQNNFEVPNFLPAVSDSQIAEYIRHIDTGTLAIHVRKVGKRMYRFIFILQRIGDV